MNIRLISEGDFEKLFHAFKAAFTDNAVKLQPTRDEFSYRIHKKLKFNMDISAVGFDGNEMTGFILHSSNLYQGIPTAYNGGTGVLPGFRNQKMAEKMYEFLIPKIQAKFLARILLEVVEGNQKAISLYEKIGFTFKRRFHCYKLTETFKLDSDILITEGKISEVNFNFNDFEPSFIDSSEHLKIGNEKVLLAKDQSEVIGYVIMQPHLGRISQLAVSGFHRSKGVGEALVSAAQAAAKKPLTIMNIPDDEFGFDAFLKKCGFQNQVNQYEMELII
ncbi:Acetyltransferase (GNAT) domain-containing protein [Ekhidna lutea]|uniref:Acetyltransferase (GNAT) domain-containing protein n=1 Tax=Ekhidna lutea TaxID=447679 RepID=A0A239IEI8_EKHLU|nr:GNAT family N-acetyltransferase [Ekhidna lutea]SNS91971.1 Acetyltransferase (GNAT) domain-containing protein [Ekhidna lutea]